MAFDATNSVDVTDAAEFIPELWSDEVIASYKKNIVLANLVSRINHVGKKGDTIHIPAPDRDLASAKAANTEVTVIAHTDSVVNVVIDKHYEYSRLIEDIVEVQALASLRRFFTDDAGYALARQVDWHLHIQAGSWGGATAPTSTVAPGSTLTYTNSKSGVVIGSDGETAWLDTANTNVGNGAHFTDAGLRKVMQTLDDSDVPLTERALVIPPVEKNIMLGLPRFTEQAFVGEAGAGNSIRNGLVGDVYGTPVFVSSNCGHTQGEDASTEYRACLYFHKSAMVLAEQMGVRSQVQYKQEYLSDLMTSDTIYGTAELRDDAGLVVIVPA